MVVSFFFTFLFSILFSFSAFAAVASPSDASAVDEEYLESLLEDNADLSDSETLQEILAYVQMINDNMTGPGVASSSDADREELPLATNDSLDFSDDLESQVFMANDVEVLANSEDQFVNVLRYDITFNGRDYILLIPPEYQDSLYIDENNRLWNMSASQITGRAVSANFNPVEDEGYIFYLTPCLGNNFSTAHEYGAVNYMLHYYWESYYNGERLTYDTTYGNITVNESYYPFKSSDTLIYFLLFNVIGGVLILWLRNYKNY